MTKHSQDMFSAMTDFEINKGVAVKLGLKLFTGAVTERKGDSWVRIIPYHNFNPCNSWADAGDIAEKYGISVIKPNDEWIAYIWDDDDIESHNQSPARAICECFLMMGEI